MTRRGFFLGSFISGAGVSFGGGSLSSKPRLGKLERDRTSALRSISAISVRLLDLMVASDCCVTNRGGSSSNRRSSMGRSAAGGSGRKQLLCGGLGPKPHEGRNERRPARRWSALLTKE